MSTRVRFFILQKQNDSITLSWCRYHVDIVCLLFPTSPKTRHLPHWLLTLGSNRAILSTRLTEIQNLKKQRYPSTHNISCRLSLIGIRIIHLVYRQQPQYISIERSFDLLWSCSGGLAVHKTGPFLFLLISYPISRIIPPQSYFSYQNNETIIHTVSSSMVRDQT